MHFYLCFLFSNIKMGKVGSKYHLSCCLGVTEFLRLLSASISASCCFPAGSSSAGYLLSCRWGPLGSLAAAFAHLQELEMHLKAAIRSKHLKAAQCSYLVFILKAPSPLPCKDGACPCHSKGSRHWPTRQRQLPLIKGQQELHPHAPSKDKLSSTCGHSILPKLSVGTSPPPHLGERYLCSTISSFICGIKGTSCLFSVQQQNSWMYSNFMCTPAAT